MRLPVQQILVIYSAALSTVFAVILLTGAKGHQPKAFDEIQVHRINIVEPDGTLRMVISNSAELPGVIIKGKELAKEDRPEAGMLFYNDEGSENGGLIFGGHRNEKGEIVNSGGSLTFDKYGASQIVQLAGVDDKDNQIVGLAVNDQNDHQRAHRVWVGRDNNDAAVVSLMDAHGKKRILMRVNPDGTASLDFLDAQGHVIKSFSPKD